MSIAPLLLAVVVATIALATDLRARRIPNWLTAGGVLAGIVGNLLLGGLSGGALALAGAGLGFVLLLPFYVVRGVGAGDVKLLAALGALVGPITLLAVAAVGALVGGLMSIIILARRGTLSLFVHQLFVMHTPPTLSGAKAPYAVAIASGVYIALLPRFSALVFGG